MCSRKVYIIEGRSKYGRPTCDPGAPGWVQDLEKIGHKTVIYFLFFARLIIDIRAIISMSFSIAKLPRDCPIFHYSGKYFQHFKQSSCDCLNVQYSGNFHEFGQGLVFVIADCQTVPYFWLISMYEFDFYYWDNHFVTFGEKLRPHDCLRMK